MSSGGSRNKQTNKQKRFPPLLLLRLVQRVPVSPTLVVIALRLDRKLHLVVWHRRDAQSRDLNRHAAMQCNATLNGPKPELNCFAV